MVERPPAGAIDRRIFAAALASGLVIAPSVAEAQPSAAVPRIGYLSFATAEQSAALLRELVEGLRQLGHVDGRSIVIEPHYGDGTQNRIPELAAEVVRSRVALIVTGSNPTAVAAKRATSTIPIVMVGTLDPVNVGLVASLARPGGNVTGLCVDASAEMSGKNLGLIAEFVPGLARMGLLRQSGWQQEPELEAAARRLKLELHVADVRAIDEVRGAFATMRSKRVDAVIIRGSLFYVHRQQLADLALQHRLPAIHAFKEYVQAGLLMSYGANLADLYRRAAGYVDRILRGARPGDLPVEQPSKFELAINLNTARMLGLKVPPSLLSRADEVIR